jgi:hypothetical protein
MANEPMLKLDPAGKAPILSYNVPEPTSYSGQNIIEMNFDDLNEGGKLFKEQPLPDPAPILEAPVDSVSQAMKVGFFSSTFFPNIKTVSAAVRLDDTQKQVVSVSHQTPASLKLAQLDATTVSARLLEGQRLSVHRNVFGAYDYRFLPPPPTKARPRLFLIETYRLSSFLGSYGAGRTIKTFSLLPGEKTKLSIRTYKKTETDAKSASSIFDSFTQESADDFQNSIENEQSNKENHAEYLDFHVDADAHASWGWGSANISGGVKGGTNSSREEFAKNVSNSAEKHASKASAKRDVHVDTSKEVKTETGEENTTEREISNVNLSRTLNFVFRQMNQEFISLLHLVDVRIGFFNGFRESRREATLPELDALLIDVIADPANIPEIKQRVLDELSNIIDFQDRLHIFFDQATLKDRDGHSVKAYTRVKKNIVSTFTDETENSISVPGIILSVRKHVIRTDGVIVDALLGTGDALDGYSHGLQDELVRGKRLANDLMDAEVRREALGQSIAAAKDADAAAAFNNVFCCCPKDDDKHDEDPK